MSSSLRQYHGDPEKWSTVLCRCGSDLGLEGFRGAGKWQVARLAAGGRRLCRFVRYSRMKPSSVPEARGPLC